MRGQSGATLEKVREETGCVPKDVRYSTIVCGLRYTTKEKYRDLLVPLFQDIGRKSGMYAYVVSLAANAYVIQNPNPEIPSWQTFYNQMWTAVEGGDNTLASFVDTFFHTITGGDLETRNRLRGKLSSFEYRQNETSQMKRSALLHFELFPKRVQMHARTRAIEIQLKHTEFPVLNDKVFRNLRKAILGNAEESTLTYTEAVIRKEKRNMTDGQLALIMADLRIMVDEERILLDDLLTPKTPKCQLWVHAMKNEKLNYKLLPHLQRYSNYSLCWWEAMKEVQTWPAAWQDEKNRPSCFSLLPICRMQPRMLHYSWTQLEQVFKSLPNNPMFDAQRNIEKELNELKKQRGRIENPCKSGKRKRTEGESEMCEEVKGTDTESELCEEVKRTLLESNASQRDELLTKRIDSRVNLMTELFDLKKLKGKYKKDGDSTPDWRVCEFATDGVKLCLTFVSGTLKSAPNVARLVKKGYDIPPPMDPIDIWNVDRGVYHLKEGLHLERMLDTESAMQNADSVELRPVDPGCVKPIQSATVLLSQCTDAATISKAVSDTEWCITEDEWMCNSGRRDLQKVESYRRETSAEYSAALREIRQQRKKCANERSFIAYCTVAFKHIHVLADELLGIHRCKIRWAHCRKSMSYISRVADKLFKRETLCLKREVARSPRASRCEESYQKLKKEIDRRRNERRHGSKSVVLFGDGTFTHQKKHVPIPKKLIIKALAIRGLTILVDEFNTSKMCPCGQSELCNVEETVPGSRLRCHKATGPESPCCVLDAIGSAKMDRDVLATANICICGAHALQKKHRPPWLCRPVD